jgi:hypothetical protein
MVDHNRVNRNGHIIELPRSATGYILLWAMGI